MKSTSLTIKALILNICLGILLALPLGAQPHFNPDFPENKKPGISTDEVRELVAAARRRAPKGAGSVVTIPIVFHVVASNPITRLSVAKAESAVAEMNLNFRLKNPGYDYVNGINPDFHDIIADCEMEFALARLDPSGKTATGVTYTDKAVDGTNKWNSPPKMEINWNKQAGELRYVQIWVVSTIDGHNNYSGWSYRADQMDNETEWIEQSGVIYNHEFFQGGNWGYMRYVLTHEVGHYFGLRHTFGNTSCGSWYCGDDGLADTPKTPCYSGSCFEFNDTYNGICGNPAGLQIMHTNFMSYSRCGARAFTQDQKTYMHVWLNQSPLNHIYSLDNLMATGVLGGTKYTLTVTGGTGGGDYPEHAQVPITAGTPATGKVFNGWTGDISSVTDVNSMSTTVTMPAGPVTVTATYRTAGQYTLTVTNGSGDGTHYEAATVSLQADAPPAGKAFYRWTGDHTENITDVRSEKTTMIMPAANAAITATYQDPPSILIENIVSKTSLAYERAENFTSGAGYHTDRTYTTVSVPDALEGLEFIKTPNDDKNSPATAAVQFDLATTATVYIAYDDRGTSLPDWMNSLGFTAAGLTVGTTDAGCDFKVYKAVLMGGTHVFGGNMQGNAAGASTNYIILASSSVPVDDHGVADPVRLGIRISPNPAGRSAGTMATVSNCRYVSAVSLLKSDGTPVRQQKLDGREALHLDTTGLDSGVYIIRLELKNGMVASQKLLIR